MARTAFDSSGKTLAFGKKHRLGAWVRIPFGLEFFGSTFKKVSFGFFDGEDPNLFSRIMHEVLDTTCDRLMSYRCAECTYQQFIIEGQYGDLAQSEAPKYI